MREGTLTIVITDDYTGVFANSPQLERLRRLGDVTIYDTPVPSQEEAIRRLQGAQIGMGNRERTPLGREVLASLPGLRFLSMTGTGFANIDQEAATDLGIPVARTPTLSARGVAELTMGLMIAISRRIPQGDAAIRRGEWPSMAGTELQEKTIGIVGLGKIGSIVASMAASFKMSVVAWSPSLTPERAEAAGATYMPLDELLSTADVVSLHLRLSARSRGIIGEREIGLMKPTAILVNTARGALTNEKALVAALQERRIAGAALDVFTEEPLPADNPLPKMDNVVLTPHVGWTTAEVYERFVASAVDNVEAYLAGRKPDLLNPDVWEKRRPLDH